MHKFVKSILKKYDYNLPKSRCNQYFNIAIKNICKKVGFTDPVLWERTVGNKVVTKTKQKWEMISSHTARRSFATNMFLRKDIPVQRIMMVTGHKSDRSFMKYIRVTREENAFTLQGHPFFQ
jgi:integrase